jgi:malonyl-CoA O-methyltransferase
LHEIKSAWQEIDNYVHVNQFYEPDSWCDEFAASGLHLKHFKREKSIVTFPNFSEMTRSLKALGAHNMNQGRAPGLGGRQKIAALKSAYENFRRDGVLPATYDVYYLIAEKK